MNAGRWLRGLLLLLLLAGITAAFIYRDVLNPAAIEHWVDSAGGLAPVLFIIVYAIAAVLFLPGSVVTLAGGALFGPLWGTVYNLTGATLGATLAFLVARYLASDWVRARAGRRLKQLINGVEGEGWRFVAFVRLVPLFPFNLLNYALGLTRIPLLHYVLATYLCMIPGGFAYTYLGYAGREAVAGGEGLIRKGLLALALLAAVAFLPRLVARYRIGPSCDIDEFRQRYAGGEAITVLDVREGKEFSGELGHVKGAMNIPVKELQDRLEELQAYRDAPLAIFCHTDKRSAQAARLLEKAEFSDVFVVRGGMVAWNKAGYLVEK